MKDNVRKDKDRMIQMMKMTKSRDQLRLLRILFRYFLNQNFKISNSPFRTQMMKKSPSVNRRKNQKINSKLKFKKTVRGSLTCYHHQLFKLLPLLVVKNGKVIFSKEATFKCFLKKKFKRWIWTMMKLVLPLTADS